MLLFQQMLHFNDYWYDVFYHVLLHDLGEELVSSLACAMAAPAASPSSASSSATFDLIEDSFMFLLLKISRASFKTAPESSSSGIVSSVKAART